MPPTHPIKRVPFKSAKFLYNRRSMMGCSVFNSHKMKAGMEIPAKTLVRMMEFEDAKLDI